MYERYCFCASLNIESVDAYHKIATANVLFIQLIDAIADMEGMSQLSITCLVLEDINGANGVCLITTPRPWNVV